MFVCECGKNYSSKKTLNRHRGESCIFKSSSSKRSPARVPEQPLKKAKIAHEAREVKIVFCDVCKVDVRSTHYSGHLRSAAHRNNSCVELDSNITLLKNAFKGRLASYRLKNNEARHITEFLNDVHNDVMRLMESMDKPYKLGLELFGGYIKSAGDDEVYEVKSFNTKFVIIDETTNPNTVYTELCSIIQTKADEFQERDSGWALKNVLHLEVNFGKYAPLSGSSYIKLPEDIKRRRACINVMNKDDRCFQWAILSAIHPVNRQNRPERLQHYAKFSEELNFGSIKFPVSLKDIPEFEDMNNISLNVFGLEFNSETKTHSVIGPMHHTKRRKQVHINLLYLEMDSNRHYVWVKNLSRLVKSQIGGRNYMKFICDGCLSIFQSDDKLSIHQQHDCNHLVTSLPKIGDNILKFKNHERKLRVPFTVYADFESILMPVSTCQPNSNNSYTHNTYKHEAYSFAYYIKCCYNDELSKFVTYRGDDATKVFVRELSQDVERIYHNCLKPIVPMNSLTVDECTSFNSATHCHICDGELNADRVRDHCHLTGAFRGAAHNECNLNFKIPLMIPIFFHNFSGYDSHLFIKDLAFDDEKIDVIPENKEKYISITKYVCVNKIGGRNIFLKLRFLDSLRFLNSSIEKLAGNLSVDQLRETKKYVPEQSKFNLVLKKGVFPYQYIDSYAKLNETKLPEYENFFNSLDNSNISEQEYAHAREVWSTFECQTLGDYSDIYLRTDVLLLADIFENFRDVCMKTYDLDPCQYFTVPGLSWDAMLKYTKIELELFTDVDMIHFIKNAIRGGISQCSGRYARANHKYIPEDCEFKYNPNEKSVFLTYLDANNLYGLAQSEYLPYSGFRWLSEIEIQNLNIENVLNTSEIGFILEVDLLYPDELHEVHNDLPFCTENITPPNGKMSKLIPNLNNKFKYVIHYRNLQQALHHGLVLDKVHRVLEFNQSPWLAKYINLNTELRKKAVNDFEKDFYKLLNNANFGKTMENVDKRVDVKLITHWEKLGRKRGAEYFIARPNFHSYSIFSENLVAIQMNRLKVVYNKPIYIGFSVLELSKRHMYEFYYDHLKKKYADKIWLLYTDTDSLICNIETDDLYTDMGVNIEFFDTSNYSPTNQFNLPLQNKAVLGKFKDECGGKILLEFIGLRSKMYSLNIAGSTPQKKAKGVKKNIVKNEITHQHYKDALFSNKILYIKQNTFRSIKHDIYTQEQCKVGLSASDDKRYLIPDSAATLAWGHHKIDEF